MNVNDFGNPTEVPQDLLQGIMDRQNELMEKYHHIEAKSGLMQTEDCPVDLHCRFGQARLKDFSWRVTEELMEALEAYRAGDEEHFHEELIDSLHFMMEQHILIGFDSHSYAVYLFNNVIEGKYDGGRPLDFYFEHTKTDDCRKNTTGVGYSQLTLVEDLIMDVIESMGLAMNCLKNKPWKQTQMLTDVPRFKSLMARAFFDYIRLMKYLGFTPLDLYNLYTRKANVNNFRQISKY